MSAPLISPLPVPVEPSAAPVARLEPSYWHGGVPGLTPGQWILPPSVTGVCSRLSAALALVGAARPGARADRVYVTPSYAAAVLYAALHSEGGWVYRVLPFGELEADPDCPDPEASRACPRARVLESLRFSRDYLAQVYEMVRAGGVM